MSVDTAPIRVIVVDDHNIVRTGLRAFIDSFEGIECVGEAHNGKIALHLCGELNPDVILMDVVMPEMNGIEATEEIKKLYPEVQIVALTSLHDEDTVQAALQAGAIGYLTKTTGLQELQDTIRSAYAGKPSLSSEATQALINATRRPPAPEYQLSSRELEVLTHLIKGSTNREIAARLMVSHSTVKFHVSSILSKLSVSSRTEAVALALQENLITP